MSLEATNFLEAKRQEMVRDLKQDPKAQPGIRKLQTAFTKLDASQQTEFLETLANVGKHMTDAYDSDLTAPLMDAEDVFYVYGRMLSIFDRSSGAKGALKTVQEVIGVPASELVPQSKLADLPLVRNDGVSGYGF